MIVSKIYQKSCFFLEIDRTLHFSGWKLIFQRCSYSANLFRSSCKLILSISVFIVRYTIVSSANSLVFDLIFSGMSLMKYKSKLGPKTDPCGTPESTCMKLDDSPSTTTAWFRSSRKLWIHVLVFPVFRSGVICELVSYGTLCQGFTEIHN